MKVGVLTPSISRQAGGFFASVRLLSAGTSREGCDVSVFSVEDDFSSLDAAHWTDVALNVHPRGGPASFGYAPGFAASVDAADLDILHSHGLWMYPSVVARKWASRSGKPHIVSPRGMLDPWALANSRCKKRLAWRLFEHGNLAGAACLHALNDAEHDAIRARGLKNPVAVIPNGVDRPPARPETGHPPPRPDWLQNNNRRLLLFLGRIHPKKGLFRLVDAWAQLARCSDLTDRWLLAIAGWDDGGHLQSLASTIRTLALDRDILLPGPLYGEAKDIALRHAHGFVLPSLSEGLPIAILEAWSYGLPVLMTRDCNLPEGFAAGAALETASDADGMTEALVAFLNLSEAERLAMGERGRLLVETRFAWHDVARRMVEVYRWLIDGGERPTSVRMA